MVVWIGVEEFLYKENVRFLGEMMSKFSKAYVFFFFCHNLAITHPNKFLRKLDFYKKTSP